MKVLQYLLLLALTSGTQACIGRPKPVPFCDCGNVPEDSNKETKIIGGDDAIPHQFPFMARILQREVDENGNAEYAVCGGSLISRNTILTAAHCVRDDEDPKSYKVFLGEHDVTDTAVGEQRPEVLYVDYYTKHDENNYDFDYGIIKLKNEVQLTSTVQTVCLPLDDRFDDNRITVAIGWGRTVSSSPTNIQRPDVLQMATFQSEVDLDLCHISTGEPLNDLTDRMMCLLGRSPSTNICNGDSGGPVVTEVEGRDGRRLYVQTGIISKGGEGWRCTHSIAARVSNPEALRWIKEKRGDVCNNSGGNSCKRCRSPIPTSP